MSRLSTVLLGSTAQAEGVRALAGVVQFLALIRLLTPDEYGQLAVITFLAAVATALLATSVTIVAVRASAADEPPLRLLRALVRRAAFALIAVLIVSVLTAELLPADGLTIALLLTAEVVGGMLFQGLASIKQGRQEFRSYRSLIVSASATRVVAAAAFVVLAEHNLRTWALIWCTMNLVTAAIALIYAYLSVRGHQGDAPDRASRRGDTWVFVLNTLSVRVNDDIDKVILAYADSFAAAGVYTAAYRVSSYVLVPVRAVLARRMPQMFKAGANRDERQLLLAKAAARRDLAVAVLIGGVLLSFAAVSLPFLAGEEYQAAVPLALVLIPVLGLRGFQYMYGDVLVAAGSVRLRLLAQSVAFIFPAVAYIVLIPLLGAWGAVAGTAVGEVAAIVTLAILARRAIAALDQGTAQGATQPSETPR
jgi:O-antigen/teichoic acid export membrane protein